MESILLFLGGIGYQEVLVIGLVVLVMFGSKKIPEFMKGLGKGIREFKSGVSDMKGQIENEPASKPVPPTTPVSNQD